MDCLTEAEVQAVVEHRPSESQLRRVKRHIDECPDCRELVAGAARALDAGERVGRYIVSELIGVGNMGVVYRAHDPQLHRDIAIKLLPPRTSDDPELTARLLREAEALAALSHPNVVAVHDAGRLDGQVFVAMELVAGPTLARWSAVPRPWRDVLRIAVQICRGLAAAHDAGLVHRDFKPENVLITDTGRALVSDFGLARWSAEPASPREIVGTPAYMAPEQLLGTPADARSDQFALCATLYEAFYGTAAFPSRPVDQRLEVLRAGPLPPPRRGRVPARVLGVLARGLAFRPEDRHASVAALVAELEAIGTARGRWPAFVAAGVVAGAALAVGALAVRGRDRGSWHPIIEPLRPLYDEAIEGESLSPDGAWFAFTSDREERDHVALYVAPAAGGPARRLSPPAIGNVSGPRWAADGGAVYIVDEVGIGWRIPTAGGQPVRIAAPVHEIVDCAGRLVLQYWGAAGCTACQRLVVRNPDGAERELYRTAPGIEIGEPRCDRAGARVVFSMGGGGAPETDIWLAPLAGGPIQRITNAAASQNHEPTFTPDGERVVFARLRDGMMRLVEQPIADPGSARELPSGAVEPADPMVSPDGRTLYFVSVESADALFARHVDGRPAERVTRAIEDVSAPVLEADGRTLFATVIRDHRSVLVAIDLATRDQRVIGEGTALGITPDGALASYDAGALWVRPRGGDVRRIAAMPSTSYAGALGGDGAVHMTLTAGDGVEAWRLALASGALTRETGAWQLPSPDGTWTAVVTIGKAEAGGDVATAQLVPSGRRAPGATFSRFALPLVWDPRGTFIFYRRGGEIHRVAVPGGDDTLVAHVGGILHSFAVSPDGATLYTIENVQRTHTMRIAGFDRR